MPGSGKSELANCVSQKYNFPKVYFGGIVLEELAKLGLLISPRNERLVRERLRNDLGMAAIAILASTQIDAHLKSGANVIIDGLYSGEEWQHLRSKYEDNLFLIACHVTKTIRFERLRRRKFRPLTRKQAERRDIRELQTLNKAVPIVLADFHVLNNESIDQAVSTVDFIVKTILQEK